MMSLVWSEMILPILFLDLSLHTVVRGVSALPTVFEAVFTTLSRHGLIAHLSMRLLSRLWGIVSNIVGHSFFPADRPL